MKVQQYPKPFFIIPQTIQNMQAALNKHLMPHTIFGNASGYISCCYLINANHQYADLSKESVETVNLLFLLHVGVVLGDSL